MGCGLEGPSPLTPTSLALLCCPLPTASHPSLAVRQTGECWCLGTPVRMGTASLTHQECHQPHLVPTGVMGHSGPSLALALRWAGVSA